MKSAILIISLLGSIALLGLILLFIGGRLVRCELARGGTKRLFELPSCSDPLALKDLLVDFFGHKASSRILRVLAARQLPMGYKALLADFRSDEKRRRDGDGLPESAIVAVLGFMRVAGLCRVTRQGISITEVGREIYSRSEASVHDPSPTAQTPVSPEARVTLRRYFQAPGTPKP